ncbi:MAG: response regulator [Chloroflexi bacterium]|nr:response regulator [Chloroflexota bacterium]
MAKKVATIDDNPEFLQLIKDILEKEGYEVVCCVGSLRAHETIKETRPDLILLDIMMPGRSGWELLDILRLDPDTANIPVIVTTGVRAATARLRTQAYDLLKKPFDVDDLLAKVEKAIGKP